MDTVRMEQSCPALGTTNGNCRKLKPVCPMMPFCAYTHQKQAWTRTRTSIPNGFHSDDKVDFAYGVTGATGKSTSIYVRVHGVNTEVLVDSGATCNLVGLDTLCQLAMDVDILQCSSRLRAYGGNKLPVCGMSRPSSSTRQLWKTK